MNFIQNFVYIVLQLLWLPVSVAAYLYAAIKSVRYAKFSGTSMTASSVLGGRWIMHRFHTRDDTATELLLQHLPFGSPIAYNLLLVPAIVAHKLTGYVPGLAKLIRSEQASLSHLVSCRTGIIDRFFVQARHEIKQVVIMGAGYDTRLMKFRDQLTAECFELDQPATQRLKQKALSEAGCDVDWIHFVPVDFTSETWSEKLLENGFNPNKETFWLWEGVTLYLEKPVIVHTLNEMERLSPVGSQIVFDFYSLAFVNMEGSAVLRSAAKQMLKSSREPLKFGVDTRSDPKSGIESLLVGTSYRVEEFALLGRDQANAFAGVVKLVKEGKIQSENH